MGIRIPEESIARLEAIGKNMNLSANKVAKNAIIEWLDINYIVKRQNMVIFGAPIIAFLLEHTGIEKMEKLVKLNAERGADFFQFILDKPLTRKSMEEFLVSLPRVFGRNGLMWFEHIEAVKKDDKVILKAFHALGKVWSQYYIMLSDYTMEHFFDYEPIKETKNYSESSIFLEYVPKTKS